MKTYMTKQREALHQIPELALNEFQTKEYLKSELNKLNLPVFDVLETGLLVYIDTASKDTIAFRSDIDALPIFEETNHSFKSKSDGKMHACGHDGHMAMLLGFAKYLSEHKDKLTANILLIFQPAEESIGGARLITNEKILQTYNVKEIYGIHLFPQLQQGYIASKPNEFMAMAAEIDIEIHGLSAHGAMPQDGIDANMIAAKCLIDFQTIQTRVISPLEPTIITFGAIRGGTVRNQVSDYAKLEGTVRAFDKKVFDTIIDNIKRIAKGYEQSYHAKIDVRLNPGYLPVINDPVLYQSFKQIVAGPHYIEYDKPFMIAEDFSFYQNEVPGIFFFVGTKNEEKGYIHPLHSSKFDFDPDVLNIGFEMYVKILHGRGGIRE